MSILFDEKNKIFHLKAKDTSYVMGLVRDNYLAHFYWGERLITTITQTKSSR